MGPLFILCIYTFPYIVAYFICVTSNKIVFVKVKKTGWEPFAIVKTNWREQDPGKGVSYSVVARGKHLQPSSTEQSSVPMRRAEEIAEINSALKRLL